MKLCKMYACIHALLKDDHHLTITDMQQEMVACFSHEPDKATMIRALQQLEMQSLHVLGLFGTHRRTLKNCAGLPYSV